MTWEDDGGILERVGSCVNTEIGANVMCGPLTDLSDGRVG